jgi:RNA polymerase sigma factor (sigma-70 family)
METMTVNRVDHLTDFCDDPLCTTCGEHRLLGALKTQSSLSFRKLYKMYASSLLGIIIRIVPNREIAEDILQDTFVKIWRSIDLYDPAKAKLFTWMASLARNTAIDYTRGKSFLNSTKNDDIDSVFSKIDLSHQVRDQTDMIGLKELMGVLTDSQKTIIDMVYFHGYTQAEVSEVLQIPLGTVKSKIRIAVKVLRCYFK